MSQSKQPQWKPRQVLFSDGQAAYELITHMGEGPQGELLLLARRMTAQGSTGDVRLKCVPAPRGDSPEAARQRARLEEEARLAAHLRHEAIARVHGLREVEGTLYLIAEGVQGDSLSTLLNVVPEESVRFSDAFVLYVGARVASALAHAHGCVDEHGQSLGIVHRAVDLGNIWVGWNGRVKLTDFGLALSRLAGRRASTVRRPAGSAYYAAPEALLGLEVDGRADLFQLGLVLYELATGEHPLDPPRGVPLEAEERLTAEEQRRLGGAIAVAQEAGLGEEVEDYLFHAASYTQEQLEQRVAVLSEPLRAPVRRLLQRAPAERYASAQEVEAVLSASLERLGAYGPAQAAREVSRELAAVGRRLAEARRGGAPWRLRARMREERTTR